MTLTRFFFSSPFFWVILSAFFFGAGISRATRFIKKGKAGKKRKNGIIDIERVKNRKWIMVCIFFSFSILSAICALFIPGAKELADIKFLYIFIFFTVISFLGLRFKRAFGIPFLFLFIFCFIIIFLFFQALTSFTGETEIARLHVHNVKDKAITMELVLPDNSYKMLTMNGVYFAPVVKVIILKDLLVFFGAKTWYRFVGIVTFQEENESEILKQTGSFELQSGYGISKGIYRFFEENEKYIPWIKSAQREVVQKKAKKLTSYSIRVQNNGGIVVEVVD